MPKKKQVEKFDPFAPVPEPKTVCTKCVNFSMTLYLLPVCRAAVIDIDPVNGSKEYAECWVVNHGDCPKFVEHVPPPPPEPLPEIQPAPPTLWQRIKDFFRSEQ